jgi:hypothetical protein
MYDLLDISRVTLEARDRHLHDILYDLPGGVFGISSRASGHRWRRHRSHQSQRNGAVAQLAPHPMELELDQFMEVHHGMLVKLTQKMEPQLSSLFASGRSLRNTLSSVC